jgi:Mlc titration factor MtfA (ptsG expression regulator)
MVGKGRPKTRIFTPMSSATSNMLTIGTVLLVFFVIRRRRRWYQRNKIDQLLQTRQVDYDNILSRYNPYYKSLSSGGRDRFLKRVLLFVQSKRFEYIDMDAQESMPLLIGAAAVQLTYGLDHFLLDYFGTIYVVRNKYTYGPTATPYEGHVSQDGIYLSWADFTREYADYGDGQNVGLHEMAHALTYVNFTAHEGRDPTFHDAFVNFSAVARPVFERMKAGETNILNSYAATNYQEFWAVCIETFFERSADFSTSLPKLYTALCTLLNQDPLTTEKVLAVPTT